jgi:uncharacterized protein (TIGR02217 family)
MMENFFDQELPSFLYTFIRGGPTFYTEIQSSNGGREVRFANRISPINRYKVVDCKLTALQISELQKFFCAVQGRKYSFRFRDLIDYEETNAPLEVLDKENFKFQLVKIYLKREPSNRSYRKILKPEKSSIKICLNKEEINEKVSVDDLGVITISNSLRLLNEKNLDFLTANFRFDIPVRFETDALKYRSELDSSISIEPFELIEVLQ